VPHLRHVVDAFAGAQCRNALAVTEACTNVVLHAYPGRDGELTVEAWVDDQHLVVQIHDDGVGIDTRSAASGLGLGLKLMHTIAEAAITTRDGTTVRLRFPRVPPVAAAALP
jgi:two-component sensor histidine kinase